MDAVLASAYARWRGSRLGEITERRERDRVLELAGPLAGKRVLDVGCGDGTYAIAAAERGAQATGVDVSDEMLQAARRRSAERSVRVHLERGEATMLPFEGAAFDVVLAVTVLCFVGDAAAAVREMARVLAPGGRVVLGELNRWSLWAGWRRVRGWLGSPTWRPARFRSSRDLRRLLWAAGLDAERVAGAVFYPPFGAAAALLGSLDSVPARLTTAGAAFIAAAGLEPPSSKAPGDTP